MSTNNMIANRYRAIKHIGAGGMADVFLAVDTILNREVAVKVLRGDLSSDPTAVLRFQREANASTALSHPNIVDIYDVGEDRGHHFIVMEYVRGKTLKQVVQQRGALCKEEVVDIMKQLVSATAEAHKRGIIHRDIKPQNVLVKDDGTIKMVDFGIAFTQDAMQLTHGDSVMGTVHYMAPELARGEQASYQSDIYALGIVMFELLTGDVPFKAEQGVQVALMHMRNEMPSVRAINPSIPQSVENIVIRATAKNKGFRYASCNDMLNDLRTCLRPDRLNEKKNVFNFSDKDSETIALRQVNDSELTGRTNANARANKASTQSQKIVRTVTVTKKKKSHMVTYIAVLLTLLACAGIYFALSLSGVFKPAVTVIEVPNIMGLSVAEAKSICTDSNLILDTNTISYQLTDNVDKGQIIEVIPSVGEKVDKGSRVSIVVSSGIGKYIDDYVGMNINEAKASLAQYPNIKIETAEEYSETVPSGSIIRQELLTPGTQFNPSATTNIRLVYASYTSVVIPYEIEGMNIDEASAYLEAMGVQVMLSNLDTTSLTQEEIDNLNVGVVIKSNPEVGTSYTQEDGNYVILYYY